MKTVRIELKSPMPWRFGFIIPDRWIIFVSRRIWFFQAF